MAESEAQPVQPVQSKGFGKPVNPPKPNPPKKGRRRTGRLPEEEFQARKRFEQAEKEGQPIFEVFVRPAGTSEEWKPAGALAVSSNLIDRAIFDQEQKLTQSALRQYASLRKAKAVLEFGYRRKDFSDDPVKLAVRPKPSLIDRVRGLIAGLAGKKPPQKQR